MAFQEIERGTFAGRKALVDSVRVQSKNGTAAVIISNDIFKKLGAPNFLRVMIGSGEHQGFVAIIPRNMPSSGTYKPNVGFNGRGLAKFSISAKRLTVPAEVPATDLPYETTDDGLIVDLRQLGKSKPAFATKAAA